MDFDIHSMKQRARSLLRHTNKSPWFIWGILLTVYVLAFWWISVDVSSKTLSDSALLAIPIMEIIYTPFRISSHWYSVKISRDEAGSIEDTFQGWQQPLSTISAGVVKNFCMAVGYIFLFLGGFIIFYGVRFSTHIVWEEDIGIFRAMKRSMQLLKGHKKELFKLDISNLGWFLLVAFTGGFAAPFIKPYLTVVYAEFYDYLKGVEVISD